MVPWELRLTRRFSQSAITKEEKEEEEKKKKGKGRRGREEGGKGREEGVEGVEKESAEGGRHSDSTRPGYVHLHIPHSLGSSFVCLVCLPFSTQPT